MADSSDTSERERYPGTNRTRPKELTGGGRGDYCCIPGYCNALYNKHREKTKIGLFRFPTSGPARMKLWELAIKPIRRKGGSDKFDPYKKSTFVCEFHFTADEIITRPISEIKNLKENTVPSIFKLKPKSKKRP